MNGDWGRRETTSTEITDATSNDQGMEEHIGEQGEDNDNEQDKDAEEMEQSGESNEGHSSNDCIIDNELDVLPLQGSKGKVWSYFGFPAVNGRYREEDKK